MKTQITLTVELDDVPVFVRNRVRELDSDSKNINCQLSCAVQAIEQSMENQGDIRHALIYLDTFRRGLAQLDIRVQEYINILEGFITHGDQPEQVAEPPNLEGLQQTVEQLKETIGE